MSFNIPQTTSSSVTYDTNQLVINAEGSTYQFGNVSSTASQNVDWQTFLGNHTISSMTFTNPTSFTFKNGITAKIETIVVNNSAYVNFSDATNLTVSTLYVGSNGTGSIGSAFANHPALSAQGGTTCVDTDAVTFASINVGSSGAATITTGGFSGTWSNGAYSSNPGAGNGRLILNVDGDVVVGGSGGNCGDNYGGAGGGAIKITAVNLFNSGTISSTGGNGNSCWGGSWVKGGSGGTLYFNVSGIVSNSGTFSVRGGSPDERGRGGYGRIGVVNGSKLENLGTIYPSITCSGTGSQPDCFN